MFAQKYVILRPHAGGFPLIRLGFAPETHRDMVAPYVATHAPVSAGFVEIFQTGNVRTFGCSDSLCLTSAADDANLIAVHAKATHRMSSVL